MNFEDAASQYLRAHPGVGDRLPLPLITNLLKNREFKQYYLRTVREMLQKYINERWVRERMNQIFPLLTKSIQLESPSPDCLPGNQACSPTGRMFSWNEIISHVRDGRSLEKPHPVFPTSILRSESIVSFIRRRAESAQMQISKLCQPQDSSKIPPECR